jgi:hypothetical protein
LDVILASRVILIGDEDVAGELLLRVDLREEEERAFLLFIPNRYVGQVLMVDWAAVGLLCRLRCWARSGCVGLVRSGRLGKSISFLLFCFPFSVLIFYFEF